MGTRSQQPGTPKTCPWNLTFFRYKYRLIFQRFSQNSFWVILERVHLMRSWLSSDFQCLIADFIWGNWCVGRDLVVNRRCKVSNSTQKQLSWTIEAPCYHQWKLTLDFQIRSVWKCSGQDFYDEVNFAAYSGFLCALWDFRLELGLKRVSDVFRFSLIINGRRNSALDADWIESGPNLLWARGCL